MDNEARQKLKDQLGEFDAAMASIRAARKPFDDAIAAIDNAKDAVLAEHEAEVVGECEGCTKLLLVGDKGFRCEDGPILCADCSPTFGDAEEQWLDGLNDDEPERKAAFFEGLEKHLAAGGSRSDKLPLYEL
jgi:hypothetical protein